MEKESQTLDLSGLTLADLKLIDGEDTAFKTALRRALDATQRSGNDAISAFNSSI
jgi:FXSXX-COOH protein